MPKCGWQRGRIVLGRGSLAYSAYRTSGYKVIIETVVLLLGRSSLELPQGRQNITVKQLRYDGARVPAICFVVVEVRGVIRKYLKER